MRTVDPVKHGLRQLEIVRAAAACFSEKGFHGTTTAGIAQRAGISTGNLFHYFPNKRAIIIGVIEQDGKETAEGMRELEANPDSLGALIGLLELIVTLARERAFVNLQLEISAESRRDPEIAALASRNDAYLIDTIETLLRRSRAAQRIDPTLDPHLTSRWICSMMEGLFSRGFDDAAFTSDDRGELYLLTVQRLLQIEPTTQAEP